MPRFIHAIRTVSKHTANEISINRWLNVDEIVAIEYDDSQNGVVVLTKDDSAYIVDSTQSFKVDKVLQKLQPEPEKPEGWTPDGYINF